MRYEATAEFPMTACRLFFALWPGRQVRSALAAWQQQHLPAGVRATLVQDLHLTLRFLGQVEASRIPALDALGEQLSLPSFDLTLDRVGHWPRPAALWVGPSETPEELVYFHRRLGEALAPLGFEPEARTFKPHVTLARKIRRPLAESAFEPLVWPV